MSDKGEKFCNENGTGWGGDKWIVIKIMGGWRISLFLGEAFQIPDGFVILVCLKL